MERDASGVLLASEVKNGDESSPQNGTLSKHQPVSTEVTLEPEDTEVQLSEPEAPAQSDEDSDVLEEGARKKNKRNMVSSDKDWLPQTIFKELTEQVQDRSSEEDSDGEPDNETSCRGNKILHLCSECGRFFWPHCPHTCINKLKPHACNLCGRRYATEQSLKQHNKSHDDSSEHCCEYCFTFVITQQDKLAHKQIHRKQSKPYQCRFCTRLFASFVDRNKHMKGHRGPFEHKCDICGISFWGRHSIERHMVVHTGEKPYKCSVCERGFKQYGHLKSHMRLHTGERPYACPHCDKAFNHNVSLKSHIQRYHPSESGTKVDNSCDAALKTHDTQEHSETGPAFVEDVQKWDTEQNQQETFVKPKFKMPSTGRPLGRPKRSAAEKRERSRSSGKKCKWTI